MIPMRSGLKRLAAIVADAALSSLALVLRWPKRTPVVPDAPSVLVVRCDHIGDAIMSTAVLGPLREALSASRVDVLAASWAAPVFEAHPTVDHVIRYDAPWWLAARGAPLGARLAAWGRLLGVVLSLRRRRYDIGIDLRGDLRQIFFFLVLGGCAIRSSSDRTGGRRLLSRVCTHDPGRHQVEREWAIASLHGVLGTPRLSPPALPELSRRARQAVEGMRGRYVVLALRGNKPNRSWPLDEATALVESLHAEYGLGSIYVGGPADRDFGHDLRRATGDVTVNLAGETSILESAKLMADASGVVAVDSGPMHMAAMVGTPVVALFGAGLPGQFGPWSDASRILRPAVPCGCPEERCVLSADGSGECMKALKASAVLESLVDLMEIQGSLRA